MVNAELWREKPQNFAFRLIAAQGSSSALKTIVGEAVRCEC